MWKSEKIGATQQRLHKVLIHKLTRGQSFVIHEQQPQKIVVGAVRQDSVDISLNGSKHTLSARDRVEFASGCCGVKCFEWYGSEYRCAFFLDFPRSIYIER